MKNLVIGNIEFNIEMIVGSPVVQLIIMHSAKCLETGTIYNKKKQMSIIDFILHKLYALHLTPCPLYSGLFTPI